MRAYRVVYSSVYFSLPAIYIMHVPNVMVRAESEEAGSGSGWWLDIQNYGYSVLN